MNSKIGKVLIIDDEAALRNTLSRILQMAGCETKEAEDGVQALKLLTEERFDLVFLDIHLPQVDGLQVLKEIRSGDSSLPVVLLTGFGSLQSAVEALRLGATDYLLKPFDPEVLVARARVILNEQATERRKAEIRQQISELQEEFNNLEQVHKVDLQPAEVPTEPRERFLKRGALILDLHARRATFGEEVLSIPPAAFDYLWVLSRHSPDVVSYQSLVVEAQDYKVDEIEARELSKWHVHVLRQALEINPQNPKHILNVRSVGYRLLVD